MELNIDKDPLLTGAQVEGEGDQTLARDLATALQQSGYDIIVLKLEAITEENLAAGASVICMFELDRPRLAYSTDQEFRAIQLMINKARNIIWLTSGDITRGLRPDFSVVTGCKHIWVFHISARLQIKTLLTFRSVVMFTITVEIPLCSRPFSFKALRNSQIET